MLADLSAKTKTGEIMKSGMVNHEFGAVYQAIQRWQQLSQSSAWLHMTDRQSIANISFIQASLGFQDIEENQPKTTLQSVRSRPRPGIAASNSRRVSRRIGP